MTHGNGRLSGHLHVNTTSPQGKNMLIMLVLTGQEAGGSQSGSRCDGQEKDVCPCQVSNYPHTAYNKVLYERRPYQDMRLSVGLLSIHMCARTVPMNIL